MNMSENANRTWERRGHWRTLKDGRKIFVKPATCVRHDGSDAPAETRETGDYNTSVAPTIDEILTSNNATAKSGVLNVDGKYAIKFKMCTLRDGEYVPKAFLPEYDSGRDNLTERGLTRLAQDFNASFELYVNKIVASFICAAIAKYRSLENSAAGTYENYKPDSYISKQGRRVIVIRDIHIVFASNEVDAEPIFAFKPNSSEAKKANKSKARMAIRLYHSPLTCQLAKIARDVVIMSERVST